MQRMLKTLAASLFALGMVPGVAWAGTPEGELPKKDINYTIVAGPKPEWTYVQTAPINLDAGELARQIDKSKTKFDLRADNPEKTLAVCIVNGVPKRNAVITTPEDRAKDTIWNNADGRGNPCPTEDRRVVIIPDKDPLVFTGVKHILPEVRDKAHQDIDKCKDAANVADCLRTPLASIGIELPKPGAIEDEDKREVVVNNDAPTNGPNGAGPGSGSTNGPATTGGGNAAPSNGPSGATVASADEVNRLTAERDAARAEAKASASLLTRIKWACGIVSLAMLGFALWVILRARHEAFAFYRKRLEKAEAKANAAETLAADRLTLINGLNSQTLEATGVIERLGLDNGRLAETLQQSSQAFTTQVGETQRVIDIVAARDVEIGSLKGSLEAKERANSELTAQKVTLETELQEERERSGRFETELNVVEGFVTELEFATDEFGEAPASVSGGAVSTERRMRTVLLSVSAMKDELTEARSTNSGLVAGIWMFLNSMKEQIPTIEIPAELTNSDIGMGRKRVIAEDALLAAVAAFENMIGDSYVASEDAYIALTGMTGSIPLVNMSALVQSQRNQKMRIMSLTKHLDPYTSADAKGLVQHVEEVAMALGVERGLVEEDAQIASIRRDLGDALSDKERFHRELLDARKRIEHLEARLAPPQIEVVKAGEDLQTVCDAMEGSMNETVEEALANAAAARIYDESSSENSNVRPVEQGRTVIPKNPRHHTPPYQMKIVSDSEPPTMSESDAQFARLGKFLDFIRPEHIHTYGIRVERAVHLRDLRRLASLAKHVRVSFESSPARTPVNLVNSLELLAYDVDKEGMLVGVCGVEDPRDMKPRELPSIS